MGEETLAETDARQRAINRLKAKQGFKALAGTAVLVLVLCTVIWALSGQGYFWPIWVVFGFGIALVASGWKLYGPGRKGITEEDIEREMGNPR